MNAMVTQPVSLAVTPWDGTPIDRAGIYSGVPIEIYHGPDLCTGPSISSSGLRTIFSGSPMEYWIESPLNPQRLPQEENEAFDLGRAVHHLALGEERFSRYFVARPAKLNGTAWNGNRTDCREWLDHCRGQGLTVLTPAQIEQIRGMVGLLPWQKGLEDSGLANSPVVRAGALDGLVEHTIIAKDPATGVFLKSRPDAIPLCSAEFSDLKSTVSVEYESLQKSIGDFRYDMQAALAARCLQLAAGFPFTTFGFVFVMKKPPHAVEIVELKPSELEEADKDLTVAIQTFARCLATGRWPGPNGGRGDARFIERSTWAQARAAARRETLTRTLSEMETA